MSEDAPKPPAGWYPTPEGSQRYWDGEQWLNIPVPEPSSRTPTSTPVSVSQRPKLFTRNRLIALAVVVGLLLVGSGAIVWKTVSDQHAASAAAQAAEVAAEQKAAEDKLAEEKAAKAKADAAKAAEDRERKTRAEAVSGIEESIRVMAEGHIVDGVIEGPVLSVDCSPIDGGSTDDLTEQTTVFACFVANVDNGDGTMTGFNYNSTMNWSTGSYTYGLGAP